MNPSYIYGIQQYIVRREKGKCFKSTFKCFLIKIIIMQWLIVEKMVDGVERKMGGDQLISIRLFTGLFKPFKSSPPFKYDHEMELLESLFQNYLFTIVWKYGGALCFIELVYHLNKIDSLIDR